jgi:hypothetical protein
VRRGAGGPDPQGRRAAWATSQSALGDCTIDMDVQSFYPVPGRTSPFGHALSSLSGRARPRAGVRVDPELNAQSRMGHYRSLALVDYTDALVVPADAALETPVRARALAQPCRVPCPEPFAWPESAAHAALPVQRGA